MDDPEPEPTNDAVQTDGYTEDESNSLDIYEL